MLKLLFFLFTIFIIYKTIQFVSKIFYVYSNVKNQQQNFHQNARNQQYRQKKDGKTTIHYDPNKNNGSKSQKSGKDEDYIDFEEVKE